MAQTKSQGPAARKRKSDPDVIAVRLAHGRTRALGWMAFGLVAGGLLMWKLGTVGKGVGVALLVLGLLNVKNVIITFLHPAGRIEVNPTEVMLPRGLCKPNPQRYGMEDIKHAFLLRRSIPWSRSGPILVIQAGTQSYAYPRDWFFAESDQRKLATVLNRHLRKS